MNRGNGPMSAASSGSGDSGYGQPRYPNHMMGAPNGGFMGAPSDVPYAGGPYGAARPMQSPPGSSGHPSSSTDASRPSASSQGRPPSSASSRSDARGMGMGSSRDSTRSTFGPGHEDTLQKHYFALRTYLASYLRDEKGNMKPNRARDKLLRLSVTQFMELSTDVYDELIRREDDRTHRVPNVPRSLPPKQTFHPKRNQARQKLSTLPVERFRQLATDVFFELERRVPRFMGNDSGRPGSSGSRAPSRGGMRPPPGWRGPPGPRSRNGSDASSLGRPLPKNFAGGMVVPNKSTMVEDDDEEDDAMSGRFSEMERDKETIKSQEIEIDDLRKQVEALEGQLQDKNHELSTTREQHETGASSERSEWYELREELERKVSDVQRLNEDMHNELEVMKRNKHMDEQELREQLHMSNRDLEKLQEEHENLQQQLVEMQHHSTGAGSEEQQHRINMLEGELATQEGLIREVREEAMQNLLEMRDLSRQNDRAVEQEEKLATQVTSLEREVEDWRERYARLKAQNKSLRASTMGLSLQSGFDNGNLLRKEGLISQDGLVQDVDITRFQMAIDELLKSARQDNTSHMIESVKQVTMSVQSITANIGTDGYPTPSPSPHSPHATPDISVARLKARVTGTANSLITATKQHATGLGLSPVALLDAAASNLTASIVELVKAVGVRPSGEARDADLDSFYGERDSEDYGQHNGMLHPPQPGSSTEGGLTRENSSKKPNGWFSWSRRSDNSTEASLSNGHHSTNVDDYDPYR